MTSDVIDQGSQLAEFLTEAAEKTIRHRAKPEQVQDEHGNWEHTECVDCGVEIPEGRLELGKVRCIDCQEVRERRQRGYFSI